MLIPHATRLLCCWLGTQACAEPSVPKRRGIRVSSHAFDTLLRPRHCPCCTPCHAMRVWTQSISVGPKPDQL